MNYLKLFIFAISLAYKFAFSETIKCFLDNLNPNLGIYQGNTNINVILQCNIYNTTLIQNLLHGARIYFGSNSIIVNKDSIYFEGYISEFGYTPQLIASEVFICCVVFKIHYMIDYIELILSIVFFIQIGFLELFNTYQVTPFE